MSFNRIGMLAFVSSLAVTGPACFIDHPVVEDPGYVRTRPTTNVVRGNSPYAVRNVLDGEVITGPKTVTEKFVGVDDDRGRPSQTWALLPLGGRKYQLQVSDTLECLADHGHGIQEEACNSAVTDQHWLIVQYADHHEIMFRESTKCLTIAARGKLVDGECHGESHQLWDFVPRRR